MQYFSFPSPNDQATCADEECPCPKEPLERDALFLFISNQVVTERRRDPKSATAQPMLLCQDAARRRNLDLDAAATDTAHWRETGSVALRASPRRELKFSEFTGTSIDAAQQRARDDLGDTLIGTDIVRDIQETSATAQGDTADEALTAATARVPDFAFDVKPAEIIQEGERGRVTVTEFDESDARRAWRREAPRGAELVNLETEEVPKKGIVGLGKKPGKWAAEWSAPFYAKVTYKIPAMVQARFFA